MPRRPRFARKIAAARRAVLLSEDLPHNAKNDGLIRNNVATNGPANWVVVSVHLNFGGKEKAGFSESVFVGGSRM